MDNNYVDDINLNKEIEEGMKKDGYTEGNTLEEIDDINMSLLKSEWVQEAMQIPLDLVDSEERYYLEKCINKELFTPDEQEVLQKILSKYRPAILKVKPAETLELLQSNKQLIEDEHTFLEFVDSYNEVQVIPFTFYIGDTEIKIKFDLYPVTDASIIDDITTNLNLFEDLTRNEQKVHDKIEAGRSLNREELIIQKGLERKARDAEERHMRDILIEYLAVQLKFHNKDSSCDDMRKVFSKLNDTYLALLFTEVQERNHLTDTNLEKCFQEFD